MWSSKGIISENGKHMETFVGFFGLVLFFVFFKIKILGKQPSIWKLTHKKPKEYLNHMSIKTYHLKYTNMMIK